MELPLHLRLQTSFFYGEYNAKTGHAAREGLTVNIGTGNNNSSTPTDSYISVTKGASKCRDHTYLK